MKSIFTFNDHLYTFFFVFRERFCQLQNIFLHLCHNEHGKNVYNENIFFLLLLRLITLLIEQLQMICVVFLNDVVRLVIFTSPEIGTPEKVVVLHLYGMLKMSSNLISIIYI